MAPFHFVFVYLLVDQPLIAGRSAFSLMLRWHVLIKSQLLACVDQITTYCWHVLIKSGACCFSHLLTFVCCVLLLFVCLFAFDLFVSFLCFSDGGGRDAQDALDMEMERLRRSGKTVPDWRSAAGFEKHTKVGLVQGSRRRRRGERALQIKEKLTQPGLNIGRE